MGCFFSRGYHCQVDLQWRSQPEMETVTRLIQAIGRTVLYLDDDLKALSRLWCLYEVHVTVRLKRVLITLFTSRDTLEETAAMFNSKGPSRRSSSMGDAGLPAINIEAAKCGLLGDKPALIAGILGKKVPGGDGGDGGNIGEEGTWGGGR